MILSIGIDTVTISNVERFLRHPEYADEIFTEKEQKLAEEYGVGKDTIAYSWLLRLPQKVQVITGTANSKHLINAAKAAVLPSRLLRRSLTTSWMLTAWISEE